MSAFWNKLKKEDKQTEKKSKPSAVSGAKKGGKESGKEKGAEKKAEKKITEKNQPEGKDKKRKKPSEKKSKKAKKKVKIDKEKAKIFNRVLIKPKVSESSMAQQAIGKYSFVVAKSANKGNIKEAIEAMYRVEVRGVNIINCQSRAHNFRGRKGRRKGVKKAIVTLRSGDTIELFKEVK